MHPRRRRLVGRDIHSFNERITKNDRLILDPMYGEYSTCWHVIGAKVVRLICGSEASQLTLTILPAIRARAAIDNHHRQSEQPNRSALEA